MLIGIDGNEANVSKRVGIGEYAYELLVNFYNFNKDIDFRIYLKDKPRSDLPAESKNWQYKVITPRKFWTQFSLPINLFMETPRPNIFFSPSHYAPRFSTVPTIISIMDLSYIHYPKLFAKKDLYQLTKWTAYSANQAFKIFTISMASKNDIINCYKVKPENVIVTYPGIKKKTQSMKQSIPFERLRDNYSISEKFILFVGTIQPRKNISRLIEAFKFLLKNHNDLNLVIAGKKGWLYEPILNKPAELGISDKVKFLDFATNDELNVLYKNALFFILPSLYEGFGLPILEAMQYGCPVITSDVSSMPEAGGDAALYIDPENTEDIAEKMKKLIENKHLREQMIQRGYEHVKKFSWENTAKQTLGVLEKAADKKGNSV